MTDTVICFVVGGVLTAAYLLIENHMKQNEPLVGGGVVVPTGPKRKGVTRYCLLCAFFWLLGCLGVAGAGVYYSVPRQPFSPGIGLASFFFLVGNVILGIRFLVLLQR